MLPSPLQNAMTFGFGVDFLGEPVNPVTFPWAQLNNHKVTLSFKPATPADEQTLASLLPPGPITDPSQLPSSIPSYLINVIPEIAVDGQVVGQGYAMRLGYDLEIFFQASQIGRSALVRTYKVPAGAYLSLSAIQGSISSNKMQTLQTVFNQTRTIIQSNDAALLGTLTKDQVLGDIFYAGALSYWGQYIALAHVAAFKMGARHNLVAGFGSLGYEPNVDYFFGFPRAIKAGGVAVNVYLADVSADVGGDTERRINLQFQIGMLSSALEHSVPEQMFSIGTQQVEGISAVKALQIAAAQGQRIYHITPANQAHALPNLRLDGLAMDEINTALATGKQVIAHTDRISVPGFTGEGYILFDPDTGSGAYKIAGGSNGGFVLVIFISALLLIIGIYLLPILIAAGLAVLIPVYLIMIGLVGFIASLAAIYSELGSDFLLYANFMRAIVAYLALLILGTPAALTVLIGAILWAAIALALHLIFASAGVWHQRRPMLAARFDPFHLAS